MRVCIRSKNDDNERRVGVRRVVIQESIQENGHPAKKSTIKHNTVLNKNIFLKCVHTMSWHGLLYVSRGSPFPPFLTMYSTMGKRRCMMCTERCLNACLLCETDGVRWRNVGCG